jgi:hypothetical protein
MKDGYKKEWKDHDLLNVMARPAAAGGLAGPLSKSVFIKNNFLLFFTILS